MKIRIATRESELALFQANFVAQKIVSLNKDIVVELIPMTSEGDQTDRPLHEIGGKGLFVSKLESSLVMDNADIAVHSLKDVPARLDEKYTIAAVFERESSADVLISKEGLSIKDFAINSSIGTSSPRRKAQINNLRPDITIIPVRGNIATRIKKLNDGLFDGLIVAKAALNRLNLNIQKSYEFSMDEMLPSASQGYIAVECLSKNIEVIKIMYEINSAKDMVLAEAERRFVSALDGSCLSPIAILCCEKGDVIKILAKVLSQNGEEKIYKEVTSSYKTINTDIESLIKDFISEDAHSIILK